MKLGKMWGPKASRSNSLSSAKDMAWPMLLGSERMPSACLCASLIAAAFSAIDELTDATVEIIDFEIVAATPGRDAIGEVNLHARIGGRTFAGRGASTDVVDAAARAYINVLNKAEQAEALEGVELEKESHLWGV